MKTKFDGVSNIFGFTIVGHRISMIWAMRNREISLFSKYGRKLTKYSRLLAYGSGEMRCVWKFLGSDVLTCIVKRCKAMRAFKKRCKGFKSISKHNRTLEALQSFAKR